MNLTIVLHTLIDAKVRIIFHFLTLSSKIFHKKFYFCNCSINQQIMTISNMWRTALSAAVFTVLAVSCASKGEPVEDGLQTVGVCEVENPLGFCPDSLEMVEGKVKNGQFFSTLLHSLGMSQQEAYNLTEACDSVFDVRSLRIGNSYQAYYDSSVLEYLVYERDRASNVVFDCRPPYGAWVYEKPITVESRYADVTINTSLWNDMLAADVSPLLIVSLSDIYAWTIDFFALQKGDRFRVLYEERVCDGEVIAVDTVRYAVFSHGGQELPMIMFDQKDGGNIWWNDKGESMRKAFPKAPLQYSRVSSGFSYARKHPVTRKVQPHTGVDYAAPKGTPVMTIGDGVVTSVKYEGAGGNTVRIRHNSVYTTAYLHLSKYAKGLKAGQRVRQGEVIGYVGSTGRSTGPHLDFRVWKNGTPINPLKMDSPPAEPIKDENRAAFETASVECCAKVDTIQAQKVILELMEVL
jgi:murein DD-endopeptidase MepM/ murein hydrolase activator NlpD